MSTDEHAVSNVNSQLEKKKTLKKQSVAEAQVQVEIDLWIGDGVLTHESQSRRASGPNDK